MPLLLALWALLCWGGPLWATEPVGNPTTERPAVINTVPPTPRGLSIYVNDEGDLLSPEDEAVLRQKLQALDEAGIAQISVLTLPDTERDLSEFAPEIMNTWGIRHREKADGVLILANAARIRGNLSGNRIFVGTGFEVEGVLPDAVVGRILDEQALPAFSQGHYSGGIRNTALTIAQILQGDAQLQEHYSRPPGDELPDWLKVLLILLFLFFFFRGGGPGVFIGGGGFGGGLGGGGGFGGGFGGGRSSGGGGAGR